MILKIIDTLGRNGLSVPAILFVSIYVFALNFLGETMKRLGMRKGWQRLYGQGYLEGWILIIGAITGPAINSIASQFFFRPDGKPIDLNTGSAMIMGAFGACAAVAIYPIIVEPALKKFGMHRSRGDITMSKATSPGATEDADC